MSSFCPFCDNVEAVDVWPTTTEYGGEFRLCVCGGCGSAYLDPAPTEEQLLKSYDSGYYGTGGAKFPPLIERFRKISARCLATRLVRYLPSGPSVMDVGCGDGSFLEALKSVGAGECHGIEPAGPAARRAACNPGIVLHTTTLSTFPPSSFSYALVTARHVFEHLPQPKESLHLLADLVSPAGCLFLSLPNIASWQARYYKGAWFHLDAPRHLHLAAPDRLVTELEKLGFYLVHTAHLSLEQNVYGWIQSTLNQISGKRNLLYERLKGNRGGQCRQSGLLVFVHCCLAGFLLPFAVVLELLSVAARRGATIQLTFRRV